MCVGMGTGVCGISGVGTNASAVAGEIEPGSVTHMHLHLICLMLSPTRGASKPEKSGALLWCFGISSHTKSDLLFDAKSAVCLERP